MFVLHASGIFEFSQNYPPTSPFIFVIYSHPAALALSAAYPVSIPRPVSPFEKGELGGI
jgi:hypothetical protein